MEPKPAKQSIAMKFKERWQLILFSLPFAGVGIGFLVLGIVPPIMEWQAIRDWRPVQAELEMAKLEVRRGDDSTTYKASADYQYTFSGQSYRQNRVAIGDGFDNIGDFNAELSRRLEQALASGHTVTAYVNPNDPGQAVLNRDLRFGLLGIKLIFVLIFGGVGMSMLLYALLAPTDKLIGGDPNKPWQSRRAWASSLIKSNGKQGMYLAWGVAVFWNIIAIPTGVSCVNQAIAGNTTALVGLVFPVIGLGLFYWAISQTANWRRFGPSPLQMDPYPGAIGGQVGGAIDVRLPYSAEHTFSVALQCVHCYYTGSGDNRKRSESITWQSEGFAATRRSVRGTLLEVLFDVDKALPASQTPSNSYHFWRLNVKSILDGPDFNRSYELPVFPTGERAGRLRNMSAARPEAVKARERALEEVLDVQHIPGGVELHYPAFRHPVGKVAGAVLGGAFTAAGFVIGIVGFGAVFTGIGVLVLLGFLYSLAVSLDVKLDRRELTSRRSLLGVRVNQTRVPRDHVTGLTTKESHSSSSGGKHTIFYKIEAQVQGGKPVTVGYNFAGREVAHQALESLSVLTGVPVLSPVEATL